ncbi:MAG: hypothetical protein JNJ58_07195 [Chitinophagaceae bacterium]|nr:hypothetical protein [Chitinophagaceae bacterium]
MPFNKLFGLCLFILIGVIGCKKAEVINYQPYTPPADLRVGTYKGMFQECGTVVCYNIDTTFEISKENNKYYVIFGNHKDEIEYDTPAALDFSGVEFYALDSSGLNYGSMLSGYCRNDSAFVIFTHGWGVYNNNLLSGKKQ